MTDLLVDAWRRSWLFAIWVAVGVIPAAWLTVVFAPAARWGMVLPRLWADFLAGPVLYWGPVLLGHPSEFDLHPMAGVSTWVYAACLPLAFAHPARPGPTTAAATSAAFAVWYGWAWLAIAAVNVPC